jgi:dipeptidyl aminopeptidase/acylaminoacyl peptidase
MICQFVFQMHLQRFYSTIILVFLSIGALFGQPKSKPELTLKDLGKWSSVGQGSISDDGSYACYTIYGRPLGHNTLVIQSTKNIWKKEFIDGTAAKFTKGGKLIFKVRDSLALLTPGINDVFLIAKVHSFKVKDYWIAYQQNGETVLLNTLSNREKRYQSVNNYEFSPDGRQLLLDIRQGETGQLELVQLHTNKTFTVWENNLAEHKMDSYTFGNDGSLAWIIERPEANGSFFELWYRNSNEERGRLLVNDQFDGLPKDLLMDNKWLEFSEDGNQIFFCLRPARPGGLKPEAHAVLVDVWNYQDAELQTVQLENLKKPTSYVAAITIQNKKLVQITREQEEVLQQANGYALVRKSLGNFGSFESYWNMAAQCTDYLVSVSDGSRIQLRSQVSRADDHIGLSPSGKWIVYFDFNKKNYFSYEIASGITRNITEKAGTNWLNDTDDNPQQSICWSPLQNTWLKNDERVFIYDNYDIWLIDPGAKKTPVNLTNGYGVRNSIKFTLLGEGEEVQNISLTKSSSLFLNAFNKLDKTRGFFKLWIGVTTEPVLCSMGPCQYGFLMWEQEDITGLINEIKKAKESGIYLLSRMSSHQAPNYYTTSDFKTFQPLSDVQPQKNYNWYTSELVNWKSADSNLLQGILYKPENFDSSNKYPVIFYYYEKRSDGLNLFLHPKPSEGSINIPLFVSQGYLVFIPDINFRIGLPGQSALNAVVSAARYVSKFSWVDSAKMGLQGHSWGGYETNFIIAHTNLFAAAGSAAGESNMVSDYGSSVRGGFGMYHKERIQGRMAKAPWEDPEGYTNNSPIFRADRIGTPLLIMHNKADRQVPFAQGIELFVALRRLGKKVWLLQYDNGGHSLEGGKDAEDYHTRMMQFFDHYLKEKPAPKWMTRGIPAAMKGIDDGLELDDEIKTSGPGLLVKEKQ